MKVLILILLPFFSFAQNDRWVLYNDLPVTIKSVTDSSSFINCLELEEGGYIVEFEVSPRKSFKRQVRQENYFTESGEKYDIHIFKQGTSPIVWALGFDSVAIILVLMIHGNSNIDHNK